MSEAIKHPGPKPRLEWIALDKIMVDHNYQRDVKPARVRKILREFSWSQFQPVMLADQGDGTFNCFDGQHKVEAARLHPHVDEVPCYIVNLNGVRAEAEAFIGVNVNRTAVSTVERYWAGLEAGNPDMMAVCVVVEDAGCEVAAALGIHKPKSTLAITAVSRAIKHFGDDAVINSMKAICEAWPTDKKALRGVIIEALARIFKWNSGVQYDRVVQILSRLNARELSNNAEVFRQISGGSAGLNVSRALVASYNRNLLPKNHIEVGVN